MAATTVRSVAQMRLRLVPNHAPVTESEVDPSYIGCTCERFEAHVDPAQRPRVWALHGANAGMTPVQMRGALARSAMTSETFGTQAVQ